MSAHFSEKINLRAKSISALLFWWLLNGLQVRYYILFHHVACSTMPVLPDLQLSKQNKADMVTAVANLSQQNVVANLTGHTVLHNSMQPQLGHFIENELYWQPRRVPLHPRLLQRSGRYRRRHRVQHRPIVSDSFHVHREYVYWLAIKLKTPNGPQL